MGRELAEQGFAAPREDRRVGADGDELVSQARWIERPGERTYHGCPIFHAAAEQH